MKKRVKERWSTRDAQGHLVPVDLTGQVFGRLTVVSRLPQSIKQKGYKWLCRCSCGNDHTVLASALRNGSISSCGCVRKEKLAIGRNHRHADSVADYWLQPYKYYSNRAKRDSLTFNLSYDEFKSLTREPCHYCGASPAFVFARAVLPIPMNGIDRMDSAVGYETQNCVSCCRTCNWMKRDTVYDAFLLKVKAIYDHRLRRTSMSGFSNAS